MTTDVDPPSETTDPDLSRRIGARVRGLRQTRHLTLRELAARAGMTTSRLSGFEEGGPLVDVRSLVALAAALDVGAEVLLDPTTLLDPVQDRPGHGHPADHWRHFAPLLVDPGLAAAAVLFHEIGYHGTTLEAVAARAGLSREELAARHPEKQDLLQGIFAALLDDLRSRTAAALLEADGALEHFTHVVECLSLHHALRRDLSLVAQREMRNLEPVARERMRAARVAEQRAVDATVLRGTSEGMFSTHRPREAARAVVSLTLGVSHWFDPDGPDTAEQVARQQVDFALALVGHRAS